MLSTDIISICTLTVTDISVWYAMSQVFNFATCVLFFCTEVQVVKKKY